MQKENEIELVKEAKKGNDEAFTVLFHQNYLFLYNYLMKLTFQKDLTEELVQETMLKAYIHLPYFKGKSKFSTWLFSIASRLLIDEQRKYKRRKRLEDKISETSIRQMKWRLEINGEEWSDYLQVFATLDSDYRMPILLHHYYGFSYQEIGTMLQLKEGTVKSRVHNGIKKMRKELS